MVSMSAKVPAVIIGQGEALAALGGAAARFFAEPSEARAIPVRAGRRRLEALRAGALSGLKGPAREDWLDVSRWLDEAAEHAGRAVDDALALGAEGGALLGTPASGVAESAAALERALVLWARHPLCEGELSQSKRLAAGALEEWRKARAAAASSPRAVAGMRSCAVLQRLSDSAEGLSRAADRLGQLLALAHE